MKYLYISVILQIVCFNLHSQTIINDSLMNVNSGDYYKINVDSLLNLRRIRYLYIFNQSFNTIPPSILKSKDLIELSFVDCEFNNTDFSLKYFNELKSLNLHGSFNSVIPSGINNLKNLSSLTLSNNSLATLPTNINFSKMNSIKELIFDDNEMNSINFDGFQNCQLSYLSIRCNRISRTNSTDSLYSLNYLDLSSNNLENINILAPNLKTLIITNNKLKTISQIFLLYRNLKYLDIQQNQINDFSDFANGLAKFPETLEHLDIGGNNLNFEDIKKIKLLYPNIEFTFNVINSRSSHCISK